MRRLIVSGAAALALVGCSEVMNQGYPAKTVFSCDYSAGVAELSAVFIMDGDVIYQEGRGLDDPEDVCTSPSLKDARSCEISDASIIIKRSDHPGPYDEQECVGVRHTTKINRYTGEYYRISKTCDGSSMEFLGSCVLVERKF